MNKVFSVLSIIGSLIAMASFVFDVNGKPISSLGKGARAGVAALLALLGMGSWIATPPAPLSEAAIVPPSTVAAPTEALPATATIIVEAPLEPATADAPRPLPKPVPVPVVQARTSSITYRGVADDELTMQVRDALDGRAFTGSLEQGCTRDDALEGLITCELTLRVRVGDEAAFSIDARGGGFTERAAERQGRERLAMRLTTKTNEWKESR